MHYHSHQGTFPAFHYDLSRSLSLFPGTKKRTRWSVHSTIPDRSVFSSAKHHMSFHDPHLSFDVRFCPAVTANVLQWSLLSCGLLGNHAGYPRLMMRRGAVSPVFPHGKKTVRPLTPGYAENKTRCPPPPVPPPSSAGESGGIPGREEYNSGTQRDGEWPSSGRTPPGRCRCTTGARVC